jgi:hypothetical protein
LEAIPKNYDFLDSMFLRKDYEAPQLLKCFYEAFPSCCGASIIHGFYGTPTEFTKDLLVAEARAAKEKRGLVTLIVNDRQLGIYAKVLKEKGWQHVFTTSNPNHQDETILYLYVKNIGARDFNEVKKVA